MRKSLGTAEHEILKTRLVQLRQDAGLSQRALAARLQVTPSWVAKVELGERRLDLIELVWWCQAVRADAPRLAADIVRDLEVAGRRGSPAKRRGKG